MITISVKGGGSFEDHVKGGIALERMWLSATSLGLSMQPWSPVFGFARSKEALSDVVGREKSELLYPYARATFDAIGMEEGVDHYVLSLRVHSGPPASIISQRLPVAMFDTAASTAAQ